MGCEGGIMRKAEEMIWDGEKEVTEEGRERVYMDISQTWLMDVVVSATVPRFPMGY